MPPREVVVTVGQRIGMWTCLAHVDCPKFVKPSSRKYVRVRCECNTVRVVAIGEIMAGNSRSCGCANRLKRRAEIKAHCVEVAARGKAWRGK